MLNSRIKILGCTLLLGGALGFLFNNCAKSPGAADSASTTAEVNNAPDVGAKFSGQIHGLVDSVDFLGHAWGYASDPGNLDGTLKVFFYLDGPLGSGTFVGSDQANKIYQGPNKGHFFYYQLPPQFADSKDHILYVYAHEAKPENLIFPGSLLYQAFTHKAEAVFNQQLRPFVQSNCTQCHNWDYNYLFAGPARNPLPGKGGTATNNLFIRKMSGLTGHTGGIFCPGGINAGICLEIQKWWNAEFN